MVNNWLVDKVFLTTDLTNRTNLFSNLDLIDTDFVVAPHDAGAVLAMVLSLSRVKRRLVRFITDYVLACIREISEIIR